MHSAHSVCDLPPFSSLHFYLQWTSRTDPRARSPCSRIHARSSGSSEGATRTKSPERIRERSGGTRTTGGATAGIMKVTELRGPALSPVSVRVPGGSDRETRFVECFSSCRYKRRRQHIHNRDLLPHVRPYIIPTAAAAAAAACDGVSPCACVCVDLKV